MGTKVNSNYEDLLTFTRASKGHALRPVSYGDELVTNGDFSDGTTGWTASTSVLSIDSSALKITSDGVAGNKSAYQVISGLTVGGIYEISLDVVSENGSITQEVRVGNGPNQTQALFEYLYVTGETYNFKFVATAASHYVTILFYDNNGDNTKSSTFDNISVKEVTFDESDGTLTLFEHPEGIPRVEWDSAGNRLGLLVEESRTNLVTYSEDFTNSSWVKSGASVTKLTSVTAPDGSTNVYHFQENSSNAQHQLQVSITAGTQVFSVYAKADGSGRHLKLYGWGLGSNNESPIFDLDNGVVYEPPTSTYFLSASMQDVGNGWYRCSLEADTDGGTGSPAMALVNATNLHGIQAYTGDGSSGIYIWGAQLEAGSFPTSYIKSNSGSTTTRSADVASIPVSDFGYNQSALTVLIEASHFYDTFPSFNRFWELADSTDEIGLYGNASTQSYVTVSTGGAQQITFSSGAELAADANAFMKYAVGLKTDNFNIARDGSLSTGDTSVTMPSTIDTFSVGQSRGGAAQLNGHIKSIQYYPRRLTDAQLQALTEPRSTPTLSLTFDGLESSYTENYIHG